MISLLIKELAVHINTRLTERYELVEMRMGDQMILECIFNNEGITPGELAKQFGQPKSSVSDSLARLSAKQYLTRVKILEGTRYDNRLAALSLSSKGQVALRDSIELREALDTSLLSALPSKNGNELIEGLRLLLKRAQDLG